MNARIEKIDVILFDLGGVLIDFVGLREISAFIEESLAPDEIRRKWVSSPANTAFERGEIGGEEFAERMVDEWNMDVSPEEFRQAFEGWITGPFEGTHQLLADLRNRFTLACLSNTNALHWNKLMHEYELADLLDHCFASHLMGLTKPDAEIFGQVSRELNVQMDRILFLDDGPENAKGAQDAGMMACCVSGIGEITTALNEIGLV